MATKIPGVPNRRLSFQEREGLEDRLALERRIAESQRTSGNSSLQAKAAAAEAGLRAMSRRIHEEKHPMPFSERAAVEDELHGLQYIARAREGAMLPVDPAAAARIRELRERLRFDNPPGHDDI
jgi:hypothetical protein